MASLVIAPSVGGSRPRNVNGLLPDGVALETLSQRACGFRRWGLGFRQWSFRLLTRVLQGGAFSVCQRPLLFGHALVPSGFHFQVNPMTQEPSSEFLLTGSGIQHRVPRRTVFVPPALQTQELLPQCLKPEQGRTTHPSN